MSACYVILAEGLALALPYAVIVPGCTMPEYTTKIISH